MYLCLYVNVFCAIDLMDSLIYKITVHSFKLCIEYYTEDITQTGGSLVGRVRSMTLSK